MSQIAKVQYTAKTDTTGSRENAVSRSSDGVLDIRISIPGSVRIGTNPEQLLAAGWSASFGSAVVLAARKRKIALLAEVNIGAEVDLNLGQGGYFLVVRLSIQLPGVDSQDARSVVNDAHKICPFSRAMRGDVGVTINLV